MDIIHESPDSNQEVSTLKEAPSVFAIVFWLCAASVCAGLLIYLAEYLLDKELPSSGFISTILPAMVVGALYGGKSGEMIASKDRWLAILLWGAVSFFVFGVLMFLFYPSLLNEIPHSWGLYTVMFGAVILSFGIAYLAFRSGEKMGIKTWEKKKQQKQEQLTH
ncbi:ABZJ_00895 family protein [Psychromonas aquimarina]|uniref:ABZJ_00895 family protein n=1 Tax=Psychromonas aquimarina TaxID=444919 RepID=UPI00048A6B5F|nr:ABZJ_00895 family protein [Psychromonas aquimarina]